AWLDITQGIRRIVEPQQPPRAAQPDPRADTRTQASPSSTETSARSQTRKSAQARATFDADVMRARGESLMPNTRNDLKTYICLILTGDAPQVLRPSQLNEALGRALQQEAQFGKARFFDMDDKTSVRIQGNALYIEQEGASILVDEQGSVRL